MVGKGFAARLVPFWLVVFLFLLATCSKNNGPVSPVTPDPTPPAAIGNLVAMDPTASSLALQWTAPGSDGAVGTASEYDVRYSTSPITAESWAAAVQVSGEPRPKPAGSPERFVVTYLSPGHVYYFAVIAADENSNWSALSNVASDTTRSLPPEDTPPAAVADLAASSPTAHSVTLTWTAPGDNGNAGTAFHYEIRYSLAQITNENWTSATIAGTPSPKPAGSAESFEVTGLASNIAFYFALRTEDRSFQWSPVSNVPSATTLAVARGWSNLGRGVASGSGKPRIVGALSVFGSSLIAGGEFSSAGGVAVDNLAAWDGTSWSSVGAGIGYNPGISSLVIYRDRLLAGCKVDSRAPFSVWEWDGISWASLPGLSYGSPYVLYNDVFALLSYNDLLIAGGLIMGTRGVHGVPANSVLSWDGSAWTPVGPQLTFRSDAPYSSVNALAVYNGQLVAGGDFLAAAGDTMNSIASWNGSSWLPLGKGVSGGAVPWVTALAVYGGKLIVGGYFMSAGGAVRTLIAAWDGTSWSALGTGLSGEYSPHVAALAVYNGRLIAGGSFSRAGAMACNNIAAWDGSSWSPLSDGVDSWVSSLTVYNGKLIVGGAFRNAGGYPASCIASWTE